MKMGTAVTNGLFTAFGFGLCYLSLSTHPIRASNRTISFREIRMQENTTPDGTLADASSYDGANGQVVGFSCVPSGKGAVCYMALDQK